MDKADVIAIARSYDRVPFRYQGRDRNGLDCFGLLCAIAEEIGHPFADHTDYLMPPARGQLPYELKKNMISTGAGMHPGGVVLLTTSETYPTHCAVYTGTTIIHALIGRGVREHPWRGRKPFKFAEGFVFKGVDY